MRSAESRSLIAGTALMGFGAVLLGDQADAFSLSPVLGAAAMLLLVVSVGVSLVWRSAAERARDVAPAATGEVLTAEPSRPGTRGPQADRFGDLYRGGFGLALIAGIALVVMWRTGVLDAAGGTFAAIAFGVVAFALILAPFWWRLGQSLADERAERIRSQERAEVAAHIHDSVLQTLTLVQKRAGDPREVAQLARAQERELRDWLFEGDRPSASESVAAALSSAAAQVEDAHRVPVEVVSVGDAPATEGGAALVAAAREAMVNAAKFAGHAGAIAVYAELGPDRSQVFVRDRGDGFDPSDVPAGRQGVRESIIGRMERAGGTARIRSGASGTEVELTIGGAG